jgi:hypothetical protein
MAHSKYSDKKLAATDEADRVLDTPEHTLHLGGARRYDPDGGASAEDGAQMSLLSDLCSGDWSWKPWRYKQDPGHIFTPEEIEALYPNRMYFLNARLPA